MKQVALKTAGELTEPERYIPRMNSEELFSSPTHYLDFIPAPYLINKNSPPA